MSISWWRDKTWSSQAVGYHSAMKRNGVDTCCATTWMNLESIVLSKSQLGFGQDRCWRYRSAWDVLLDLTGGLRPDKPIISRKYIDYTSPTAHKRLASPTLNVLRTQHPKALAIQYTAEYPLCALRVTCLPGSCGPLPGVPHLTRPRKDQNSKYGFVPS